MCTVQRVIDGYDLMMWRLVSVCAQNGNTALSIARRLGYISVVDTLKVVTEETLTTMVRLHVSRTYTDRFSFKMSEMSTSVKRRDSFASPLHITYSKQFRCITKYIHSVHRCLYTQTSLALWDLDSLSRSAPLHLSLKKNYTGTEKKPLFFL